MGRPVRMREIVYGRILAANDDEERVADRSEGNVTMKFVIVK
jgi:hypothetical protein